MNIENLEKCFYEASKQGARFVGVKIQMQGFPKPEIIINEHENFDSKFAYYKKAYNDDLTLKTFNGIKIVGFTYGDSFETIEHDLMCPISNELIENQAKAVAAKVMEELVRTNKLRRE